MSQRLQLLGQGRGLHLRFRSGLPSYPITPLGPALVVFLYVFRDECLSYPAATKVIHLIRVEQNLISPIHRIP